MIQILWKHNPLPDLLQELLDKNYTIPRQQRKNKLQIDIYAVSYFVLQKVTSTNDVEFVISGMHAEYGGTYEIKFYFIIFSWLPRIFTHSSLVNQAHQLVNPCFGLLLSVDP